MLFPGICEKTIAEQAARLAHATSSTFSDDIYTPFRNIGMDGLSDEALGAVFEDKRVLEIGSGVEGIARRLFKIFGDSNLAPKIINLNPQLAHAELSRSVLEAIRLHMRIGDEDITGYMRQRVYSTGVVQALPFEDGIFDIQISTWGFPKCMFDFWDNYSVNGLDEREHAKQGYKEILRTQAIGGIALLAPVMLGHEVLLNESYLEELRDPNLSYEFRPTHGSSTVLRLQRGV